MYSKEKAGFDLDELYRDHHLTIKKISLRHCNYDNDLAEDAVQHSYLALMESIEKEEKDIDHVLAYLIRIAINYLNSYFKKYGRVKLYENLTEYTDSTITTGDAHEMYLKKLTDEKLEEALDKIKEKDEVWHQIVTRVYIQGVSQVEVARELGLSSNAVYARIRRYKIWANKNLIEYRY